MTYDLTILIPVFNEAESLKELYGEIVNSVSKLKKTYEVIFVNDGSTDRSQVVLEKLQKSNRKTVRIIELRRNFGKAAALDAGFRVSKGKLIITMDSDLQDDPKEISVFLKKLAEGYDLVSGWKVNRKDSFIKNNTSKIFNYFANRISRVELHDYNCGYKAYTKELVDDLVLYGELYRYIPVLAASLGYKVTEVPVNHRVRKYGITKYGPIRFINGALDLITVFFLTRFRVRPLHLFGYISLVFFLVGFLISMYLSFRHFAFDESIGNRPLLLLSVMLIIIGIQIGVTGLVGEQITTLVNKDKPMYRIKKRSK
jgi:glycosyltransferase involved in cell wall biosynthesis